MKLVDLLEATVFGESSGKPVLFIALDEIGKWDPCEIYPADEKDECDVEPGADFSIYAFDYSDPKDYESETAFVEGAEQIKDILDAIPIGDDIDIVSDHSPGWGYYVVYEMDWGNVTPTRPDWLKSVPYLVVVRDDRGHYRPPTCDELARLAQAWGWRWNRSDCTKFAQRIKERIK